MSVMSPFEILAISFIVSSSVIDGFKIDKKTSEYLSFNYADTDSSVYEIEKVRKLSDFIGKRFLNEYYDFEVSIPKDSITAECVNYEIVVKRLNNTINEFTGCFPINYTLSILDVG